jgi:hypothetical protein
MRPVIHCRCALVALVVACLGTPAASSPFVDDFESSPLGALPTGWNDVASVDPTSTVPKPSAVVVSTTDAFGNPTRAVATLPKTLGTLPSTGISQGIYRGIGSANLYSTSMDVRIDRFSDHTDFDCGCDPAYSATFDWPVLIGFAQSNGTLDLAFVPQVVLLASAWEQNWQLFVYTANVSALFDLGAPITLGTWYGAQIDLDVAGGTVRSRITDSASGSVLADVVTVLPAAWDPLVDGVFDIANYYGGELTAVQTSGLATIDNIRLNEIPEPSTILLLVSALAALTVATGRIGFRRETE